MNNKTIKKASKQIMIEMDYNTHNKARIHKSLMKGNEEGKKRKSTVELEVATTPMNSI
jgi:hypothetical protein